jgi:penicillin amidase
VNAWVREIREGRVPRPFEYRWLELDPEPWSPEDTLAIVRYRAWLLGRSLDTSLLLDRLVRDEGGVDSQEFFPTPDLPTGELVGALLPLARIADRQAELAGLRGPVGSLGFVVGGLVSESGFPILVNDPHVELRLPPLFHLVHLRTPFFEAAGAAWPGVPVLFVGSNGIGAWGQVSLHGSVSDLYEEELDPGDPGRYQRAGRWVPTQRREERVHVRGAEDEVFVVTSTRHGPLLRSALPEASAAGNLALAWTGHAAESGIEALLRVQRADSFDEFRQALRGLPAPAATFLWADRDGHLGSQVAGLLPIRSIDTGLLPVPGRSGFYDWRGSVPFDELPSVSGPHLPWLVASTRPGSSAPQHPVAWLWSESAGEERVRRTLARRSRLDMGAVLALEREQVAEGARREVGALLDGLTLPAGSAERVARALLDWDGRTTRDSEGAAVWHVFRHLLAERLLYERLDAALARAVTEAGEPIPGVVLAGFLGRVPREQARRHVVATLESTWSWLSVHVSSNPAKWTWGRVHAVVFRHDFERLGDPWLRFVGWSRRVGPLPVPGSAQSVFAIHSGTPPPFRALVGPALSFAVDLAHPDHPQVALAGGQSGHPGDGHYTDALADWLDGRPRPLWMDEADVSYHAVGTWELSPPRSE